MKKIKLSLFLLLLNGVTLNAQINIDPAIFGQNAWFYNIANPLPNDLDTYWPDVKASGVTYVRIGGIGANFDPLYNFTGTSITPSPKLKHLIDQIRTNGMEPIIQVGYNPVCGTRGTLGSVSPSSPNDQATIAGNLVDYFNNPVTGQYKTNPIKYWIIANEPDLIKNCTPNTPSGYGWDGNTPTAACTTTAACANLLSGYIKDFSTAMKGKDKTIKIIAPEFASFNNDYYYKRNELMEGLLKAPIAANPYSVMGTISPGIYYVDIVSFHHYPDYTGQTAAVGRASVIANPTACKGFKNILSSTGSCGTTTMRGLIQMINASGRDINNIKIACTEFNLDDAEDSFNESTSTGYTNMRAGNGNRSFIGGQWMADIFSQAMNTYGITSSSQKESWVQFMNPWSIRESGSSPNGPCYDGKGYISSCGLTAGTTKRSTYYHYQMLATNFKGTFFMGTTPNPSTDNFKAFASNSCDGINIMLMNQNTGNLNYRINLDATMPTVIVPGEIRVQIGTYGIPCYSTQNMTGLILGEETIVIHCTPCGKQITITRYAKGDLATYTNNVAGSQRSCACTSATSPSTARCANADTSTLVLTHDLTIKDSTIVMGTIKIPAGVKLTIENSDIAFLAEAKIESVLSPDGTFLDGKVVIINSNLHGCDGQSWGGIHITSIADTSYNPIVIQNSTIDDASLFLKRVRGGSITNSSFSNGVSAIVMDHARGFTITGNSFSNFVTAISTSNSQGGSSGGVPAPASIISNNRFADVGTAINCVNDNHSNLDISCNEFYNCSMYGVKTTNTTIKDQGNSSNGTGNRYINPSSLINSRFSHNGNSMIYYTDPSDSFTLTTGLGMNATSSSASADGCGSGARFVNQGTVITDSPTANGKNLTAVPNPNNGLASVSYTLPNESSPGELIITNMFGQVLSRYPATSKSATIDIDCSQYASGIYFLSLIQHGSLVASKKMVISK